MLENRPFIYRPEPSDQPTDALSRKAIKRSLEVLKQYPAPDTFAGRKTQEAFPQEEE